MINFCLLFHVYNEIEAAKKLAQSIKSFYSDIDIICIFDGLKNASLKEYLESLNVKTIVGDRLFPQINGGEWLIRCFQTYLKLSSAPALVRIDPDTMLLRRVESIPNEKADIAGTLLLIDETQRMVSGGCTWFKRATIQQILNSNILEDERYRILRTFGYQRYSGNYIQPGETENKEWLIAEDKILASVAARLQLKLQDWAEVSCNVFPVEEASDKWGFFHPLKYKVNPTPVNPPTVAISLASVKAKIQEEIIELAAKKQRQLVASYPEQEQKSWEGPEGKVAEARAILSEGISAAKSIKTEAIASFKPTTESEIETAILNLAQIIVRKSEELRHALGFIAGTRANKWAEVEALTNVEQVLNYPYKEGW